MTGRTHGGLISEELAALGIDPTSVLDFSVNVNPYGPHPAMLAAVRGAPVERYPDPGARQARAALAAAARVAPERVALGNGAAELLWTLARVLVPPGAAALIVEPTFSELRAGVVAGGGRVVEWHAAPGRGFAVDVQAVAEAARAAEARLVYLGTPNNPTGRALAPAEIAVLAARIAPAVVILDEAFLSLGERHRDAEAPLPEAVVRVRSLTKEHAIPGVRVGYAIAPAGLADAVESARPAWSVGAAAQAAAEASVTLEPFVAESRARLMEDRRALEQDLRRLDLRPLPSEAPFLLVPVPDGARLRRRLLVEHRILVRDCSSFGLPGYVRLAARPAADRGRLVAALRDPSP